MTHATTTPETKPAVSDTALLEEVRSRLESGHTVGDIAAALSLELGEDEYGTPAVVLPGCWRADDGNAEIDCPLATSGQEAAEEYVDGGEWGEITETTWIHVWAWRRGLGLDDDGDVVELDVGRERYTVALEPEEPECTEDSEHDWRETSVRGHGGGVVVREVCHHCGTVQVTDTWAQDRSTGEQGLTSVRYEEPECTEDC